MYINTAGVKRSCGKNCRIRWNNQQILQIETNFSPEEEDLIIKLHSTIGSRLKIFYMGSLSMYICMYIYI